MFTGIVAAVGRIVDATPSSGGLKLRVDAGGLVLDDVGIGDSIAVNGACLTVVARTDRTFDVDVSRETLACVAGLEPDTRVNLEKALRLSDRLGGHFVTGHVDGVARVEHVEPAGDNCVVQLSVAQPLSRYLARKGSIAVNGVSLTVNDVRGSMFAVNLIPHTLEHTNLSALEPGSRVNIEVDLLARYSERLLSGR